MKPPKGKDFIGQGSGAIISFGPRCGRYFGCGGGRGGGHSGGNRCSVPFPGIVVPTITLIKKGD